MSIRLAAVIPTLGKSPWLGASVGAFLDDAGEGAHARIVAQGEDAHHAADRVAQEIGGRRCSVLHLERNVGFARGTNLGIDSLADGEFAPQYTALINDDAFVISGWSEQLLSVLEEDFGVAAAQGINLIGRPEDTERAAAGDPDQLVDGAGIAWSPSLQALQLGYGQSLALVLRSGIVPVFGVSATAAIYRTATLDHVSSPGASPFREDLESWYEDVELAGRLRATGQRCVTVAAARALHAGSTTGATMTTHRARLLTRNRWLVLADLLGASFLLHLPMIAGRDFIDLVRATAGLHLREVIGIKFGLFEALLGLPVWCHLGRPRIPLHELSTGLER